MSGASARIPVEEARSQGLSMSWHRQITEASLALAHRNPSHATLMCALLLSSIVKEFGTTGPRALRRAGSMGCGSAPSMWQRLRRVAEALAHPRQKQNFATQFRVQKIAMAHGGHGSPAPLHVEAARRRGHSPALPIQRTAGCPALSARSRSPARRKPAQKTVLGSGKSLARARQPADQDYSREASASLHRLIMVPSLAQILQIHGTAVRSHAPLIARANISLGMNVQRHAVEACTPGLTK